MALLSLEAIHKEFPGVVALDGVCLDLEPGHVHALAGENGAGKSTLINIISGVIQPDRGRILRDGREVSIDSPRRARRLGIAVVHQEAAMFPDLTVAENIALPPGLPRWPGGWVRNRCLRGAARQHLAAVGADNVLPGRRAELLSAGQRQLVAIATAVSQKPRILLLDEPTASLTAEETERLHVSIRRLAASGTSVLYISHRIEELFQIADMVTVLRDGKRVWTKPLAEIDRETVVSAMVGRKVSYEPVSTCVRGSPALQIFGYTDRDGCFKDVHLEVHHGEVVGLYGMVGSGRSELAQSLMALRAPGAGTVKIHGREGAVKHPEAARGFRLCYVPEDRLTQGIFAGRSVRDNICAASWRFLRRFGWVSRRLEQDLTNRTAQRLEVTMTNGEQPVESLSGGNQQKTVLGRWLATDPDVLLLDEPTRGIDVGAKAEIHRIIDGLVGEGKAILLISSELPELVALSHRVYVMRDGRLAAELSGSAVTEPSVAAAALGGESADREQVAPRGRARWINVIREMGLVGALALAFALFAFLTPRFAEPANLVHILADVSLVTIAGVGMTAVIVGGGLDISIGSILALASACSVLAVKHGAPTIVGLSIALGIGAALGALNGSISAFTRVHPIVVTLGMLSVYKWAFLAVLDGQWIREMPAGVRALARARVVGLPAIIGFAVAAVALGDLVLRRHVLGRHLYAAGGNEALARTIGVRTRLLRVFAFAFCGATVGLAAILWAAQYNTVQSNLGEGFELQVIAACVVGGAAITGGSGSVIGTATAALLIGVIYNGMVMLGVHSDWQKAVFGVMIVAAVLLDRAVRRLVRGEEEA